MARFNRDEYASGVVYLSVVIILYTFAIIHFTKIYQDLNTPDRKALDHRSSKPTINRLYRARTFGIGLQCVAYAFSFSLDGAVLFPKNKYVFTSIGVVTLSLWAVGRTTQYSVFVMRLHHTYGHTNYAYPKWVLGGIVIWGFTAALSVSVLTIFILVPGLYDIDTYVIEEDDGDLAYDGEVMAQSFLLIFYGHNPPKRRFPS